MEFNNIMEFNEDPVYLVGLPAQGHPGGARYLGFRRYLNTKFIDPPLKFRFFKSLWGWRLDRLVTALSPRPYYTFSLFLMECRAALHMLFHRRTLYHAIKGDVDLSFLPRVSRWTGNALVASFHEPPEDLVFWKINQALVRDLAGVLLLGENQRIHFNGLIPPERVFVLPHGVDSDFFTPGTTRPDHPTCIAVGSHLRDARTLVEGMRLVWREMPDVRLLVVGARRPHDPNPPPEIEDERVEFVDHIDDEELVRCYHRSSVAVLSLKMAVANNALLEAMSSGLPVVASRVGAIADYLGQEAGILCAPGEPAELAAGILRILGDDQLAAEMGRAGRGRALQYDHRVVAEQLAAIYAEVRSLENSGR